MRKTKVKEKIREIKDEKKQLNKPKPIPAQKPINQSVPTNNINIEPATKKCPWDGVIPLPPRAHAVVLSGRYLSANFRRNLSRKQPTES